MDLRIYSVLGGCTALLLALTGQLDAATLQQQQESCVIDCDLGLAPLVPESLFDEYELEPPRATSPVFGTTTGPNAGQFLAPPGGGTGSSQGDVLPFLDRADEADDGNDSLFRNKPLQLIPSFGQ